MLASRGNRAAESTLAHLVKELDVTVVPFTDQHAAEAVRAYSVYGRGRHPAGLNFGDCLSYAAASLAGDSLLFVGRDFSKTDIGAA